MSESKMPHHRKSLDIEPQEPITTLQPALTVTYSCIRCGKSETRELAKPGFLPRYCEDCRQQAANEKSAARVQRWRERHPEQARQQQRDYRAKKTKQGD